MLDILEASRLAMSYVEGVSREAFMQNTQLQDAVIRRIEIIGEAARRVSFQTQDAYREIPWKAMIGMRNLMIHDYDDVDLDIVWNTVIRELPRLLNLLESKI
jgi:uncharacterized protein with HEPN domain